MHCCEMSDGHAARETLEWDKRGRVLTAARTALYVFREEEEERRRKIVASQQEGERERAKQHILTAARVIQGWAIGRGDTFVTIKVGKTIGQQGSCSVSQT